MELLRIFKNYGNFGDKIVTNSKFQQTVRCLCVFEVILHPSIQETLSTVRNLPRTTQGWLLSANTFHRHLSHVTANSVFSQPCKRGHKERITYFGVDV